LLHGGAGSALLGQGFDGIDGTGARRQAMRGALASAGAWVGHGGLGRLVLAACAFLLVGCASNAPGSLATSATATSGAEAAPKGAPVKVALLASLSAQGQPGVIGKAFKQAGELALFDRDSPHLQLLIKDDKGTPEGAATAASDAIKDGASLIVGPLFAKSVAAVAPIARQANVPVIAFSNDRQVAGRGVYLLSFQPTPEIERVITYAGRQGKRRFAALIPDDAFGKLAAAAFREAVERAGATIVALETYPASANGMLEPMRKVGMVLRAAQDTEGGGVDALFLPGGQENLERIARLMPQADIDSTRVKVLGTGGMDYANAGHNAGLVGAWYAGPDPRGWEDFAQKFAKTYATAPPRIASLAYDAVSLAITLSAAVNEAERYAAGALTRPSGFTGVDGSYRLSADGTAERGLAVLEVQKIGAGIIDPPALGAAPATAGSAASGLASGLFNFFNN
jgi:ABC-type branched-subunit amino acid transport system substrate-binding protein